MITPKFLADIKNGKLILREPEKFNRYLKSLKNTVEVIIRYPKKKITDPQRKYLFGVAYKLVGDHLGMTVEQVHYSEPITKLRMDYTLPIPTPKSVSRQGMSTREFNEYKERLQEWAARELNLFIPDPDEIDLEGGE